MAAAAKPKPVMTLFGLVVSVDGLAASVRCYQTIDAGPPRLVGELVVTEPSNQEQRLAVGMALDVPLLP